jgi:threonine dehydrogenase-like Zn-dependent dehydrogenase
VFELTGDPQVLNPAIDTAGFGARVIIGSWYGVKSSEVRFGHRFHRSRIVLISSQVSTLPVEFTARWDRSRRLIVVWEMIRSIRPSQFITHEIPVENAAEAYRYLDLHPAETLQVLLTYSGQ